MYLNFAIILVSKIVAKYLSLISALSHNPRSSAKQM